MKSSTSTALVDPTAPIANTSRRQPLRQARTNPSRTIGRALGADKSFAGDNAAASNNNGNNANAAPGFYPAITHFTDSITALPKEMIRHHTMLKEVDAKIWGPEQEVKKLASAILKKPPSRQVIKSQQIQDVGSAMDVDTSLSVQAAKGAPSLIQTPMTRTASQAGSELQLSQSSQSLLSQQQPPSFHDPSFQDRVNAVQHFHHTMREMLLTLDEKNHVLTTATDALDRQLKRCQSSYVHINDEISEEARLGNPNHWAYMERPIEKPKAPIAGERTTRNTGANNSKDANAAQTHEAENAAARSDARREAMMSRKRQHHDSDVEEARNGAPVATVGGSSKKATTSTSKSKKVDSANNAANQLHGLGVVNGSGTAPSATKAPHKRQKTEKTAAVGGVGMERSMSGVYGPTANPGRGRGASPRESPAVENLRKKGKAPTANGASRKRAGTNASANNSPLMASSPIIGTFATTTKAAAANSPLPPPMQRTLSSRARNNSIVATASQDSSRRPPSSAASNKPGLNGLRTAASPSMKPESFLTSNLANGSTSSTRKGSLSHQTDANNTTAIMTNASVGTPLLSSEAHARKTTSERPTPKREKTDPESQGAVATAQAAAGITTSSAPRGNQSQSASRTRAERPPSISTSTRPARAASSKVATPVSASFPNSAKDSEAHHRPRSARASFTEGPTGGVGGMDNGFGSSSSHSLPPPPMPPKRSHKKGAGLAAQIAAQKKAVATTTGTGPTYGSDKNEKVKNEAGGIGGADEHERVLHGVEGDIGDEDGEEEVDEEGEEPTYCYCNQISYGDMIGCDNAGCKKEWFHLACVGLKTAPSKNSKWYCRDCAKLMKKSSGGSGANSGSNSERGSVLPNGGGTPNPNKEALGNGLGISGAVAE